MIAIHNELAERAGDCMLGFLAAENVGSIARHKIKPMTDELEENIRRQYGQMTRSELKALHPMDSYVACYRKFGYTYHVLPQLESVCRGRAIPGGLPLVAIMFMAELGNFLLTAGHDLDRIHAPLRLRAVYRTGEFYGYEREAGVDRARRFYAHGCRIGDLQYPSRAGSAYSHHGADQSRPLYGVCPVRC